MYPHKYSLKWEYLDDDEIIHFVEETTKPIHRLVEPVKETRNRRNMNLLVSTIKTYLPNTR